MSPSLMRARAEGRVGQDPGITGLARAHKLPWGPFSSPVPVAVSAGIGLVSTRCHAPLTMWLLPALSCLARSPCEPPKAACPPRPAVGLACTTSLPGRQVALPVH